ncbi:GAF domain-containing protein [Halomicroarcula sp. GCM10025709]|uniref:GAF domain-containing protein n=1 Tax=Halomicroarcula sp. GCM10025709 TaxID=3252669 RepID=UPI003623D102
MSVSCLPTPLPPTSRGDGPSRSSSTSPDRPERPRAPRRYRRIDARGAGQAAYPVPKDEGARIAAVREYDIDELRAADAFDRVTELVVSHFDIDVAFVGLVDAHEEQFVACEGANWSTLSREDTVCTHTVLTDEVMVVEDTHEDPRFAANDRLDELDIRSYAGARITDADGNALGAVCCIDGEPRSYSHTERADLRRFADEVEEQLRLRKRLSGEEM